MCIIVTAKYSFAIDNPICPFKTIYRFGKHLFTKTTYSGAEHHRAENLF